VRDLRADAPSASAPDAKIGPAACRAAIAGQPGDPFRLHQLLPYARPTGRQFLSSPYFPASRLQSLPRLNAPAQDRRTPLRRFRSTRLPVPA